MAGPEGYWEKREAEGKKPRGQMGTWERIYHDTRDVAHKLKSKEAPQGF